MACEFIRTEAADGLFTVTLDRPEKLNAITPAMHIALEEAFDRFAADDALHVCIVTGAGERAFCAGSDLGAFDANSAYPKTGYAGIAQRWDLAKPVIAAVNGLCLGGGFELALSCDLIVASETAVFGLPEPKVGLIAIGGGIHRLVRQVGIKQAMGPLLTGRNVSAPEGLAMGFISEVAKPDELIASAQDHRPPDYRQCAAGGAADQGAGDVGARPADPGRGVGGAGGASLVRALARGGGYGRGTESLRRKAQTCVERAVVRPPQSNADCS